ncbi:hypothetical protein EWB00_009713 [Schistosoma japonicum]|uniref:Uncharacterized protein n=1 Tax=Schistosoma japonicum TaxID=6182 RepID=A0A4Z2CLH2_SCHJA|nr:hypothetical protein EWB00_009713 [Schistosoma japonicum]
MREEIRRHYPKYSFTLRLFTFHHKDFARKAIEYSEQCTASLKQIFSPLSSSHNGMSCPSLEIITVGVEYNTWSYVWKN